VTAFFEPCFYVIPENQKIYVYTSPDESKAYKNTDVISAAPVLPDFEFVVADLFARPTLANP
jgi:hypothetical protein